MTEDVTSLTAGRELDKRVATAIGWTFPDDAMTDFGHPPNGGIANFVPLYSVSETAAVELVERTDSVVLTWDKASAIWSCKIGPVAASSKTLPEAVAKAVMLYESKPRA